MIKPSLVIAVLLGSSGVAHANTSDAAVNFDSGVLDLFGAGSPSDFGASGYLVGNNSFGISFAAAASSGSLHSSLSGTLTAQHADQVGWFQRRRVMVGFGFTGDSGSLQTALAGSVAVQAHMNQTLLGVPITWNPTLLNLGYGLNVDQTFAPEMPQSVNATDRFAPAAVRLDLPSFGLVLDGSAGTSVQVTQTATLNLDALKGIVVATHRDSGQTVVRRLSFDGDLGFNLPLAGFWDFDVRRLTLPNTLTTDFRLDIRGDIEFGLGTGCGNFGSDGDNGPLCIADERVAGQRALDLFTLPQTQIPYGSINLPGMFSIEVAARQGPVTAVPEPATAATLLVGLATLLGFRRRATRVA